MEVIAEPVHARINESRSSPVANEGDRGVLTLLSYCVAKVMAAQGEMHAKGGLGHIVTA